MNCPVCGDVMRKTRIGGSRRREVAYVCPVSEKEVYRDMNRHLVRRADAIHDRTRVWKESELAGVADELGTPTNVPHGYDLAASALAPAVEE